MISDEVRDISKRYLNKVKPSGPDNIMAVCPFHLKADGSPEHTPSFALSLQTGLWFCHSCKESGNLRTLLKFFEVSPLVIERRYKLTLEELDKNLSGKPKRKRCLILDEQAPLDEGILGLFYHMPVALREEGFKEKTLFRFGVGFDEKHMRMTFPIRNLGGKLVGFSGRTVLEGAWPRYKFYDKHEYEALGISPRTLDKSNYLWNGEKVYPIAYHKGFDDIFVVEGFKACMWLWQAGIPNVVALMGSHLSEMQQMLLERMGGTIHLFLDTNEAGLAGTKHAGNRLFKSMRVKVVPYEAPQPTDLTEEQVLEAASKSVDFLVWSRAA